MAMPIRKGWRSRTSPPKSGIEEGLEPKDGDGQGHGHAVDEQEPAGAVHRATDEAQGAFTSAGRGCGGMDGRRFVLDISLDHEHPDQDGQDGQEHADAPVGQGGDGADHDGGEEAAHHGGGANGA